MAYQTVFCRYELKYLLNPEQYACLSSLIREQMDPDAYGPTVIRNLYYDNDSYRLIRRSMEKPAYKEKLRLRSYRQLEGAEETVFAELKKKYRKMVYKRRLPLPYAQALPWLAGEGPTAPSQTQIAREIEYFMGRYGPLRPSVFLSYEREAYVGRTEAERELRVTFDRSVLARTDDLSLSSPAYGTSLLPENTVLAEIKCTGGIPLWLAHTLSREKIFRTSFSKYGRAYETLIFPTLPKPKTPMITGSEVPEKEQAHAME